MNLNELPLNTPVVITNNDFIQVTMTRTSEDDITVIYRNPTNSDIVLDMRVRVDGNNSRLQSFDRIFWTITINGRAATERDLEDLTRKPSIGIKAEPAKRTLTLTLP